MQAGGAPRSASGRGPWPRSLAPSPLARLSIRDSLSVLPPAEIDVSLSISRSQRSVHQLVVEASPDRRMRHATVRYMPLTRSDIEHGIRLTRARFEEGAYECRVSAEQVDARCEQLIDSFEVIAQYIPPLRRNEQGIVTLSRRKTAALVADRVWGADTILDPGLTFGWELPSDIRLRAFFKLFDLFRCVSGTAAHELEPDSTSLDGIERQMALERRATGAVVQPLYSSVARRDEQYRSGDQVAVVCIVDNLQVVDEERLTWEQVIEFRRDTEARKAYRSFVHWMNKEMLDKPLSFVSDEIAQRLARYQWAVRKHGMETVLGALNNILNPKSLVSASAAAVAVDVITKAPFWSLLTAGGLVIGRAAISAASALVERVDLENANREVAYVYELKRVASS